MDAKTVPPLAEPKQSGDQPTGRRHCNFPGKTCRVLVAGPSPATRIHFRGRMTIEAGEDEKGERKGFHRFPWRGLE